MNAPYNPRRIGEGAMKRLREGLAKHGLVETLVWNQRTGNLVSGHQRLSALDALEGSQDYQLTVAVVDVDEKEEAALNVLLNNPGIQGEYDTEALAAMVENLGVGLEDMGFCEAEVDMLFGGDARFSALLDDHVKVTEVKGKLKDIKAERGDATQRMKEEQSAAFYFTVVCDSREQKEELLARLGVPVYEEFVDVDAILRWLPPAPGPESTGPDGPALEPAPAPGGGD